MVQAVKSVVRARSAAQLMRTLAWVAVGLGVFGIGAIYTVYFRQRVDFEESSWDTFLQASISAASIGFAALTATGLLLAGAALVDLYAQRLDLAIIEADDEGDIE